jgi:hypothetical protein
MLLGRKAAATIMGITVLGIFLVYAISHLWIDSRVHLEDVCLEDPSYPLCETSTVTDEEMIEYLFKEIYQNSESNSDIPYCEFYLYVGYQDECIDSELGLPEGITEFDLELISLSDGQYSFYIIDTSDVYRIDVKLGESWDVVKFRTFNVVKMKTLDELGYIEDEALDLLDSAFVRSYGIVQLGTMDTEYCDSVYSFIALDECLSEESSFNYDVLGDFEIIRELDNFGYLISLSNWYSTDEIIYEVYFEEVENELKISQVIINDEYITSLGRLSEIALHNLTSSIISDFIESITIMDGATTFYDTASDQCAIYASDNDDFDCAEYFSAIEGLSIHSVGMSLIDSTSAFVVDVIVGDSETAEGEILLRFIISLIEDDEGDIKIHFHEQVN